MKNHFLSFSYSVILILNLIPLLGFTSEKKIQEKQLIIKQDEVIEVFNSEIAFSCGKKVLATYGAFTCIIFAGYDELNQIGFLAHIVNPQDIFKKEVIVKNLRKLLGGKRGYFEIYLLGGIKRLSTQTVEAIKSFIDSYNRKYHDSLGIMKVVYDDTINPKMPIRDLAIDTRDGRVYSYDPNKNPFRKALSEEEQATIIKNSFQHNLSVKYCDGYTHY